jgi:SAM-dependent methyltransferase
MLTRRWTSYVVAFHRAHPGITEEALGHARHPAHGTAYEWLAAAAPRSAGDVLDLACGSCPMQQHLEATSYLGVDRSTAELHVATAAGRGPVRQGDVTAIPLPDASVDTVVMSMALMLVPLDQTLAEVARVLRPGGLFAAMVPATGPIRAADLLPLVVLSASLRGPGAMPQRVTPARLAPRLLAHGLRPAAQARERFPFRVSEPGHAELAVRSLYTPGRTDAQRDRAVRRLARLPGPVELPVPLQRFIARRV